MCGRCPFVGNGRLVVACEEGGSSLQDAVHGTSGAHLHERNALYLKLAAGDAREAAQLHVEWTEGEGLDGQQFLLTLPVSIGYAHQRLHMFTSALKPGQHLHHSMPPRASNAMCRSMNCSVAGDGLLGGLSLLQLQQQLADMRGGIHWQSASGAGWLPALFRQPDPSQLASSCGRPSVA